MKHNSSNITKGIIGSIIISGAIMIPAILISMKQQKEATKILNGVHEIFNPKD